MFKMLINVIKYIKIYNIKKSLRYYITHTYIHIYMYYIISQFFLIFLKLIPQYL